jgi:uncharacterized protein involved in propanediol utilization
MPKAAVADRQSFAEADWVRTAAMSRCITHHGELLQGALRLDGKLTPCLVSLPRHDKISICRLELFEADVLEVVPHWKKKALRAARIVLARYGLAEVTGRLSLISGAAAGLGLGSSTSDVVAAIRATAGAIGVSLSADDVASIAIVAEVASDPLMYEDQPLLFAQRSGHVLEAWGDSYPDYVVFGGNLAGAGVTVETLDLPPPDYSEAEIEEFEELVDIAREGFRRGELAAIAGAATRSAILNQSRVPLEHFEALRRLADEAGALGVQVSHSGVVGGVLLDGQDQQLEEKLAALTAGWLRLNLGPSELFTTKRGSNGLALLGD